MKKALLTVLIIILVVAAAHMAEKIGFDDSKMGIAPVGWTVAMTHPGGSPRWEVLSDQTAPSKPNVVAQTSTDNTAERYPLLIFDGKVLKDGALQVRFKTLGGEGNQGAGLIWRYRDVNNYYVVRADSREGNIVPWRVKDGTRTAIPIKGAPQGQRGVRRTVPFETWSTLRVEFKGSLFTVFMNEEKLFDAEDEAFADTGKTGLWTKADSVTSFDDFTIEP